MACAISFSLTFLSAKQARDFIACIGKKFQAPALRLERVVHTCAVDGDELREMLIIARDLGAQDL